MDKKIGSIALLETKTADEPLFVLKYQKQKVIFWVVFCLCPSPLIYYVSCVYAYQNPSVLIFATFNGLLYLFFCVPFVTEMLLFKEIQLYRDRIVKEWKLMGTRELQLAKVGLHCKSSPTRGIGGKYFFKQKMPTYWRAVMPYLYVLGITYQEYFAEQRQVKQLNRFLAELSGRKAEEFEKTGTMQQLYSRGRTGNDMRTP